MQIRKERPGLNEQIFDVGTSPFSRSQRDHFCYRAVNGIFFSSQKLSFAGLLLLLKWNRCDSFYPRKVARSGWTCQLNRKECRNVSWKPPKQPQPSKQKTGEMFREFIKLQPIIPNINFLVQWGMQTCEIFGNTSKKTHTNSWRRQKRNILFTTHEWLKNLAVYDPLYRLWKHFQQKHWKKSKNGIYFLNWSSQNSLYILSFTEIQILQNLGSINLFIWNSEKVAEHQGYFSGTCSTENHFAFCTTAKSGFSYN